jgi:hypothetical protein
LSITFEGRDGNTSFHRTIRIDNLPHANYS